ncbi:hypothetical protein [Amycolatopsis sp. FDAARGOS 1241]|uniref:hypothetical protein n=1 Tax=Amycolatopsis sp. FDAARGOS 1241 TaxID=2778070 RepID=UPI001EF2AC88|nr:hypothetical protein [Amycolatopsis sp. FDAARGOS 1241]
MAAATLSEVDIQESTVAAEDLTEGQWFWHEPVRGLRAWSLQVARAEVGATMVRIVTTDDIREVVSYRRDRRVRLSTGHGAPASSSAARAPASGPRSGRQTVACRPAEAGWHGDHVNAVRDAGFAEVSRHDHGAGAAPGLIVPVPCGASRNTGVARVVIERDNVRRSGR